MRGGSSGSFTHPQTKQADNALNITDVCCTSVPYSVFRWVPLIALKQELELLNQFDTKDRALSTKMEKQQHDKKEVVTAITACKAKLAATQAEAEVCTPWYVP